MQLNLNAKEWLALLGLLERVSVLGEPGSQMFRPIRDRMRAEALAALDAQETNLASRWYNEQQARIDELRSTNSAVTNAIAEEILSADDDEELDPLTYPRKVPKVPRTPRKGRRKR